MPPSTFSCFGPVKLQAQSCSVQAWPLDTVKQGWNNTQQRSLSPFWDSCLCPQVLTITLLLSWIALLAGILLLLWWITLLLGWSLIRILLLTILRVSCKIIARKQILIKTPILFFFPSKMHSQQHKNKMKMQYWFQKLNKTKKTQTKQKKLGQTNCS